MPAACCSYDPLDATYVAESPDWLAQPLRSVLVALPDGSTFYLAATQLIALAAHRYRSPGWPASVRFVSQTLAACLDTPRTLLDIAGQLPALTAKTLAREPTWAKADSAERFQDMWLFAVLTLSPRESPRFSPGEV